MAEFFLKTVNMSISAGWIVLAVILLRFALKKAPKWITVLLWGIVAVRLLLPFSIESALSLIPSTQTISPEIMSDKTPQINTGVQIINDAINPAIEGSLAPKPMDSANPLQILIPVFSNLWLLGIAIMLIYTLISFLRIKIKVSTAVLLKDNIYQSENAASAFVLGIIKPKIYIPFNMNERDSELVIIHEQAHIKRKDHWWKPFGFLILSFYWFNPLLWIAYILLCRDIELACDEKVIKNFSDSQKADYSEALLSCSISRKTIAACPLAFGEVGVKKRIKSVLSYKKPAFWIIIAAIIISVITAVCFLTNPKTSINDELSQFIDMQIAEHHYSDKTDGNFIAVHHKILGTEKASDETTVYMWVLYQEYSLKDGKITEESGAHIPTVITAKREGKHGHYKLVEYWEPRDGSYYMDDIIEKFPWYLHKKALNSQLYIDEQEAFCKNAAKEHFKADFDMSLPAVSLEKLKEEYPHFFNISTDGGLTVYIWQMSKSSYYCHLANTAMEALSDQSFAFFEGVTMEEMRLILSTYNIDKKDITIQAVSNPLSSYYYKIDKEYQEKIKKLFWQESDIPDDYDGSIPKLTVTCGDASTTAIMGTATWTSTVSDGSMKTVHGDGKAALQRLEYILPLALKVDRSKKTPLSVDLNFNIKPDSIKVNSYFLAENDKIKPFDSEVDGLSIKLINDSYTYVYEVIASWDSHTDYYGTVRYSFCVAENKASDSEYDEWGLKMDVEFESDTKFIVTFDHNSENMSKKGKLSTSPEFEIKAIHEDKVLSFETYMQSVLGKKYKQPQFAWDTVLYIIAHDKESSFDCTLTGTYGPLPSGEYLLCKKVTLTTDSEERTTKVYTKKFTVN